MKDLFKRSRTLVDFQGEETIILNGVEGDKNVNIVRVGFQIKKDTMLVYKQDIRIKTMQSKEAAHH